MIYLLTCVLAHAEPYLPRNVQPIDSKLLIPPQSSMVLHGPDGPPPDGGYTIRDDEGGNFWGKLGGICLGAGLVTGVLSLTADDATKKKDYENMTIGFLGGGVGLIILERTF